MYSPLVFKLAKNNNNKIIDNIIKHENDELIIQSEYINKKNFSLGHQYYITRNKNYFYNLLTKIDSKVYYVLNPFEINILNYEDNLINNSKKYFKTTDEYNENFYITWEINKFFDINKKNNFIISNDAEQFSKSLLNISNKNTIDTISIDEINKFKNKKNYDLIIVDTNKEWINKDNQEQESYYLIIEEIILALSIQNNNGDLILKVFDTMTLQTLKIIYILSVLYEDIFIYKPFLSNTTESDKYIICKNFKNNKDLNKLIDKLKNILKQKNNDLYLNDFLLNLEVSDDIINTFKFINVKLVNIQQIIIDEIVIYINENNYFGDKYHNFRNEQINASKWWISTFFSDEDLNKLLISNIEKNNNDKNKFIELLV
jgi:hypothetical protein